MTDMSKAPSDHTGLRHFQPSAMIRDYFVRDDSTPQRGPIVSNIAGTSNAAGPVTSDQVELTRPVLGLTLSNSRYYTLAIGSVGIVTSTDTPGKDKTTYVVLFNQVAGEGVVAQIQAADFKIVGRASRETAPSQPAELIE